MKFKKKLLFLLIPFFFIQQAYAVDVGSAYDEVTVEVSITSSTYVNITGISLTSGNFTAGEQYLIVGSSQPNAQTAGNIICTQIAHGGIAFADSEGCWRSITSSAHIKETYAWFTVWTAVSGQDITLQSKATVGGSPEALHDQMTLFALNLDDYGTEDTDWYYDFDGTDTALTDFATWTSSNNPLITFTPASSGDDWLVIGTSQMNTGDASAEYYSHISLNATVEDEPIMQLESDNAATDIYLGTLFRMFDNVDAKPQTVETENAVSAGAGGTNERISGAIFVMNLDRFESQAGLYDEAGQDLGESPNWVTNWMTIDFTPTETKDAWCFAFGVGDMDSFGQGYRLRLQVEDNVSVQNDQPPTQTADLYFLMHNHDAIDRQFFFIQTRENLNTNTHTIDGDGHATSTSAGDFLNQYLQCVQLTVSGASSTLKLLTEGIQFDDQRSSIGITIFALSEGIQFDDQQVGSRSILQLLAEGIDFDDIRTHNFAILGLITEGINFNDQRTSQRNIVRVRTEGIQFDDQRTGSLGVSDHLQLLTEGIQFDDQRDSISEFISIRTEGIQFNDVVVDATADLDHLQLLTEGIQFDDQRSSISVNVFLQTLSEGIQFNAQRGVNGTTILILTEGIQFNGVTAQPAIAATTGNAILLYCNTPQLNTVGCVFSFDCGVGNYVRGINEDGTLLCEALP